MTSPTLPTPSTIRGDTAAVALDTVSLFYNLNQSSRSSPSISSGPEINGGIACDMSWAYAR
jgi:hypothetical protein